MLLPPRLAPRGQALGPLGARGGALGQASLPRARVLLARGCGGTGRRPGFRCLCSERGVEVRILSAAFSVRSIRTCVRMTRPIELVDRSLELAGEGLSTSEIARRLGVPRSTVRDWLAGRLPELVSSWRIRRPACAGLHELDDASALRVPARDVPRRRVPVGASAGVFKLRISLDARYPGIAQEIERAIRAVIAEQSCGAGGFGTWHEVYAYSKVWPCLFPQHGPGRKQEREIALTDWQRRHVARSPVAPARADPLGWLSVPEHRAELVAPPIFVREHLRGHQDNLLRRLRSDGPALDAVGSEDDLRLAGGRRGGACPGLGGPKA